MQEQKIMVKTSDGFKVFFFDHSFKTARQWALEYIERVIDDYDYADLYRKDFSTFLESWWVFEKRYE